mmetsp:Transcript_53571/g.89142  ORF Transcript_53571/g.89142 Transcript_53571/m.89142 type:complete len:219 (-) Transcript_53571:189-845(-)
MMNMRAQWILFQYPSRCFQASRTASRNIVRHSSTKRNRTLIISCPKSESMRASRGLSSNAKSTTIAPPNPMAIASSIKSSSGGKGWWRARRLVVVRNLRMVQVTSIALRTQRAAEKLMSTLSRRQPMNRRKWEWKTKKNRRSMIPLLMFSAKVLEKPEPPMTLPGTNSAYSRTLGRHRSGITRFHLCPVGSTYMGTRSVSSGLGACTRTRRYVSSISA